MKRLWSVFTDDMDHCYLTGNAPVERHHIFGGSSRKASEQHGFIVPLRPDLHPNGVFADKDKSKEIDRRLKQMAQKYFEEYYGTRKEFCNIFGKNNL